MEDNLNKWQAIWQTKKSKPMHLNELITQLNAVEQKAKTQRLILFLLLGVLTIASVIYLSEILEEKVYFLITYFLILSAIGVKLVPSLKGKYNYINDDADFNNQIFIKKLKEKMAFKTKHLLLFLFLTILAMNFALLGSYEKGTIFNFEFNSSNRVFIHLSTLVIFVLGYIVNIRRLRQSQNKISKLISQLENMD